MSLKKIKISWSFLEGICFEGAEIKWNDGSNRKSVCVHGLSVGARIVTVGNEPGHIILLVEDPNSETDNEDFLPAWTSVREMEDSRDEEYIRTAMNTATYEWLPEEKVVYGEIPSLRGVWAYGDTPVECHNELRATLGDWIEFRRKSGRIIPSIDAYRKPEEKTSVLQTVPVIRVEL